MDMFVAIASVSLLVHTADHVQEADSCSTGKQQMRSRDWRSVYSVRILPEILHEPMTMSILEARELESYETIFHIIRVLRIATTLDETVSSYRTHWTSLPKPFRNRRFAAYPFSCDFQEV